MRPLGKTEMKIMELELLCPKNVNGIATDPQPDWSFDNLLLELETIYNRNSVTNLEFPTHFTKMQPKQSKSVKRNGRNAGGFFMKISDDDSNNTDSDSEDETDMSVAQGKRFLCDELDVSDDSEDEIDHETQCTMNKSGSVETGLIGLNKDYQLCITEEARSLVWSVEEELVDMCKKFTSSIEKINRHREVQQGMESKLDMQYKRTLAEALDKHLTAVQRDREHISQLEERRIRDDAAREEAKRKEKALVEERLKAEEARIKAEIAEKAKAAAIEAEKRAAEEAKVRHASEASVNSNGISEKSIAADAVAKKDTQSNSASRNLIRASKNALELEKRRKQFYEEIFSKYTDLKLNDNQEYNKLGKIIGRQIKTISPRVENISTRAEELVKTINSPGYPQYIVIKLFVEKILNTCSSVSSSDATIFAISRVIVLVNSKVPIIMDILLAEMNRMCIYTVPKHITYSKEMFKTRDSYLKAIGYEELDGKMESTKSYIERMGCYMRLYGAIVQTEVGGSQNPHGLREGWAWLARFLNYLPANLYSAAALSSFLEVTGYALYKRYRNQFEKLLRIISSDFVISLEASGSGSALIKDEKTRIQHYIQYKYREEPKEARLEKGHLDSNFIEGY